MNYRKIVSTTDLTHEEWLEYRKKGIGGSDAASIVGLNPWSSAYQVYCDKVGLIPEIIDNETMRQGRDLEVYVAERFTEKTGKKVRRLNAILAHADHEYLLANVDRMIVGEDAGLECKTTSLMNKTDFEGGNVPPQYYVQCMHYMMVTGAKKWYLAILVLGKVFYWFEINRNENEIETLEQAEINFWNENVLKHEPPAPDGSERCAEVIKQRYPVANDETAEIAHYREQVERYKELDALAKKIDREKDEIKQNIQTVMGEASRGVVGQAYEVRWRSYQRTGIDIGRFKEDHPDLYDEYLKTINVRIFEIKETG